MRQNGIRPARFRFNKGGRAMKAGGGRGMISGTQRKDEASGNWVRSKNVGECKGFGDPADGCMRMYQTVPDDIFHEKLM